MPYIAIELVNDKPQTTLGSAMSEETIDLVLIFPRNFSKDATLGNNRLKFKYNRKKKVVTK